MSDNQDSLALWSQYGDLYNEIVRPERKYTISHYMRTRWAPLLGAARLWFVTALRQRCFWNKKQEWCIVDKKTLARESGLSLRTVNRIVASADDADGVTVTADRDEWTSWFFDKKRRRRYHQQVGRTVNAPNRYHVLIDDPLTPDDQAALAQLLRQEMAGNTPEDTLRALQRICDAPHILLHEVPPSPAEAAGYQILPSAFAFDVVQDVCPMPEQESALYTAIARAASQLHNAITRPEHIYMGNQYFRLQWLPDLGPSLALLIVDLRARCYWNEQTGQVRDTCRATWAELAREMGCTTRQLRNLRQEDTFGQFVDLVDEGRGRAPSQFRVRLFDPLIDQDQAHFDARVQAPPGLEIDPETGHTDMYHAIQAEQPSEKAAENAEEMAPGSEVNQEILALGTEHDTEILAHGDRKIWHVEGIKAEVLARQPGKNGTTTKLLITTPTERGLGETTVTVSEQEKEARQMLAAAFLHAILIQFNIVEPNRTKIIEQHPQCGVVVAWCLYTLTQPGLSENRAGYVYNRLRNRDAPPPDFIWMAALSPPEWRQCHRAMRYRDMDLVSPELAAAVGPLSPVWETLSIEFEPGPERAPTTVEMRAPSLPAQIVGLLQGRDRMTAADGTWKLITRDLYRGCALARAATQWKASYSIAVYIEGQSGIEYELNPEILALGVEPLDRSAWSSIREELQLTMTRSVFSLWWRDVLPLGLAGNRVILGTPSPLAGEWIASRQLKGVERTCSGVLGQRVLVEFVTFAVGVDEPNLRPAW